MEQCLHVVKWVALSYIWELPESVIVPDSNHLTEVFRETVS